MEHSHAVYITASASRCLYIGMTGDLVRRIGQHKGLLPRENGFTSLYRAGRLVYYESAPDRVSALAREKQRKRWTRARKKALIEGVNPGWRDLAAAWPRIDLLPRDASGLPPDRHRDRS